MTVEQTGPLRAGLKFCGRHRGAAAGHLWLPFVLRREFFAGSDQIRLTHPFVYDGNNQTDFIAGLGLEFRCRLESPWPKRHVRFAVAAVAWRHGKDVSGEPRGRASGGPATR